MHKFYYSIRKALNNRLLHIIILKKLNIFQHQQIFVIHRKRLWHFIAIFIFYCHFLFSFYFILYKNWRSHPTEIKVSIYLQLKCCYCKYSYLFGLKTNVSSKGRRVLLKQTVRHPLLMTSLRVICLGIRQCKTHFPGTFPSFEWKLLQMTFHGWLFIGGGGLSDKLPIWRQEPAPAGRYCQCLLQNTNNRIGKNIFSVFAPLGNAFFLSENF